MDESEHNEVEDFPILNLSNDEMLAEFKVKLSHIIGVAYNLIVHIDHALGNISGNISKDLKNIVPKEKKSKQKKKTEDSGVTTPLNEKGDGLLQMALDSVCTHGRAHAGLTFHDIWNGGRGGQNFIRLLAKSQSSDAEKAILVVNHYDGEQEE